MTGRRLRARGRRGTHGLVQMVREQVAVLVESGGKMATSVDALTKNVGAWRVQVAALGASVNALAIAVDEHEAQLVTQDRRITALEKKGGKPRGKP